MRQFSNLPDWFSQAQTGQDLPGWISGGASIQAGGQISAGFVAGAVAQGPFISAGSQAGGGDITVLSGVSFAKGGPSGGGGGGGGGGGVLTTYQAGASNGDAGYDIVIDFKGTGWTAELQAPFIVTANYLVSVITADIGGGIFRGRIIDDLYVTAELKAIDGTGGILGQAGPTAVWTATELTAAGQMQFDSADAITYAGLGLWDEIVTHEFMHVVGFGSLWNYGTNPLVPTAGEYIGTVGLAAYKETHAGASFIPVETDGGSGTAGAHWDEQTLTNELMTGYINSTGNYLSKFSVMSLADLGYSVTSGSYVDYQAFLAGSAQHTAHPEWFS